MRNLFAAGEAMATKITPIDQNPEFAALTAKLGGMEKRLAETRKRRARAEALRRGAKSGRNALERALDLTNGGSIPATTPEAELIAADQEEAALRAGVIELSQQLESLRGDLSLAVCHRVEPEHTALLRKALAAIRDMNQAFRDAAALRARVRDLGYVSFSPILPDGVPPCALGFGDGNGDGRQLDLWLQHVRQHGHVKL